MTSDEINPYSFDMPAEQINRNFVSMNEWMKLERKERDVLQDSYDKLSASFATQQQEIQGLRSQVGAMFAKVFGTGPTAGD